MNWKDILKATKGAAKRFDWPVFEQAVADSIKPLDTFTITEIIPIVKTNYASLLEDKGMRRYQAQEHSNVRVNKEMIGNMIKKIGSHKRKTPRKAHPYSHYVKR